MHVISIRFVRDASSEVSTHFRRQSEWKNCVRKIKRMDVVAMDRIKWQRQTKRRTNRNRISIGLISKFNCVNLLNLQNILWALDTGIVNNLVQPIKRCTPKVVAIDVVTGKIVKTIDLSTMVVPASRLQYLVVEYDADGHGFM